MPELKEILEALIFVHRGILGTRVLEGVLKDDWSAEEIRAGLDELKQDYARRAGAIELLEVAGGFEFGTRADTAEWVQKMDHYEHHRHLSRPALETLAIIAYKQPVTRTEIESIRGVNVDGMVRSLQEKKLLRMLGRKDVPGKPIVYGTTRRFLEHFGLKSLADLPTLKEFSDQDLSGGQEEEPAILPLEDEAEDSGAPSEPSEDAAATEQEPAEPEGSAEPEGPSGSG